MRILLALVVLVAGVVLLLVLRSPDRGGAADARGAEEATSARGAELAPAPHTEGDAPTAARREANAPLVLVDEVPAPIEERRRGHGFFVLAVTERREPVAGLEVGLFDRTPWDPEFGTTATTDDSGLARIAPSEEELSRRASLPAVAPVGAFGPECAVPLDLWPMPDEPVRLVVPARGRLDAIVRGAEGEVELFVMTVAGDRARFGDLTPRLVGTAVARSDAETFPVGDVEAGTDLSLVAREIASGQRVYVRRPGPPPGGDATVEIDFSENAVVLTGRFLTEASELTSEAWTFGIIDPDQQILFHAPEMRLLGGGRFRARYQEGLLKVLSDHARWVVRHGEDVRATIPMGAHRVAGVYDLGDIEAGPDAVLVAGRVVDGRGEPRGGMPLSLHVFSVANPDQLAAFLRFKPALSDRDGYFSLPGRIDPGLRLCLTTQLTRGTVGRHEFVAGDRNLQVVVDVPREMLFGRLRFDEDVFRGLDLSTLIAVTVVGGEGRNSAPVFPDGRFALDRAGDGGEVVVESRWSGRPIERIAVPALEDGVDPREFVIDLRGRLRIARITSRDGAGEPLATRPRDLHTGAEELGFARPPHSAEYALLLHDASHHVVFEATGWRGVEVERLDGDERVVLDRRARVIRLSWPAAPRFDPRARLVPELIPIGMKKEPFGGDMRKQEGTFDERGVATVAVTHPGRYRVNLSMRHKLGGALTMFNPGGFTAEIDVLDIEGEQRFDLDWDPTPVEAMLARWREQDPGR